jgi:hypothetical protein
MESTSVLVRGSTREREMGLTVAALFRMWSKFANCSTARLAEDDQVFRDLLHVRGTGVRVRG